MKTHAFGTLAAVLVSVGFTVQVQALTITPIFTQTPGAIPLIALEHGKLATTRNSDMKIAVYPLNDLNHPIEAKGDYGNFNLTSDPSGWMAVCLETGQQLIVFHVDNPNDQYLVHFSEEQSLGCAGVSIEMDGDQPLIWIGSSGDRQVAKIDPVAGQVLETYPALVSGPFHMQLAGDILFMMNELVASPTGIPFVFRTTDNQVLVGDSMGSPQNSSLTRGYIGAINYDRTAGLVHYIRPVEKELDSFLAAAPSESTMLKHALNVTWPSAVARYGKCLAVLGHTDDLERRPQWEVLDASYHSLRMTDFIDDKSIWGSIHEEADDQGNIYVSHWKGISKVEGLFDGLDCTQ